MDRDQVSAAVAFLNSRGELANDWPYASVALGYMVQMIFG